jgi:hypothetical protein
MDAYPYRHVDMHLNGVFETTETLESFFNPATARSKARCDFSLEGDPQVMVVPCGLTTLVSFVLREVLSRHK